MKSLRELHTFRLHQGAADISILSNIEQLNELVGRTLNREFILLGSGSNCLFLEDSEVPVYINQIKGIQLEEHDAEFGITVSSGEEWHDFVKWTLDNNIYGLENLALIPGTVGAAPIQNIGAYGKEVSEYIESVDYFDLKSGVIKRLHSDDCQFGYRDSIFKGQLRDSAIVTSVKFTISKSWFPNVKYGDLKNIENPTPFQIFEKVMEIRRSKLPDPFVLGNAGSFFKNPVLEESKVMSLLKDYPEMPNYKASSKSRKVAAGWLIDQCGLKGYDNGQVQVHKSQALVLVNKSGKAKGYDVVDVANQVIDSVFEKFGIRLEPEVRFFGEQGELPLPILGNKR